MTIVLQHLLKHSWKKPEEITFWIFLNHFLYLKFWEMTATLYFVHVLLPWRNPMEVSSFWGFMLGAGLLRKWLWLWRKLNVVGLISMIHAQNSQFPSCWGLQQSDSLVMDHCWLEGRRNSPCGVTETSTCYLPLRRRRGFKASKSLTWKMVWEFMTRLNLSRKSHWRAVGSMAFKKACISWSS